MALDTHGCKLLQTAACDSVVHRVVINSNEVIGVKPVPQFVNGEEIRFAAQQNSHRLFWIGKLCHWHRSN